MEEVCIFIVLYAFVFPPSVFAINLKILKVSTVVLGISEL